MFKALLFFALFAVVCIAAPEEPRWNDRFKQDFEETFTYPVLGTSKTKGTIYYDWTSKRYAVYRENGKRDRYCGTNGSYFFYNTPCVHYVDEGVRYLYYPKYDDCCACCMAEHGCGVLYPGWVSGGEFIGEVDYKGKQAYQWNKPGLQANFYFETVEEDPLDRVMLAIDQQPNDLQVFDPLSFSTGFDDAKIQLPSVCNAKKTCSLASVCTAVRHA